MGKEGAIKRRKRVSVKWLRRILFALLLLLVLLPAAAWLFFPWYAQSLINRVLAEKPFRLEISGVALPDFSGVKFRSMRVRFTTPPDGCSDAADYTLLLTHGLLSWHFESPDTPASGALLPQTFKATITLEADSLNLKPEREAFVFDDHKPKITFNAVIARLNGFTLSFNPLSATYAIDQGMVTSGKLRLEGVNFNAGLTAAEKWQQPKDSVHIAKLFSDGKEMPVSNFRALFGSKRDSLNPCTLMLTDCTVDLFGWKATTEKIAFDLKEKSARFTLNMADIPLAKLPGFGGSVTPFATGRVSGSIPIAFRDSTLLVRHAVVLAKKGTSLLFYTKEKRLWCTFDLGDGEALKNLDAKIVINSRNDQVSGVAMSDLSATLFGGRIRSTPFSVDPSANATRLTLKFDKVNALERVHLRGDFKGFLKGQVNGTLPLSISKEGFSIRNARVQSSGGGQLTFAPLATQNNSAERSVFGRQRAKNSDYTVNEPSLLINRSFNGTISINFALNKVLRQTDGAELLLLSPKGKLMLLHDRKNLDMLSLSDCSAGLFGGRIAVEQLDYDMAKKRGETTLQLNKIPLQKLLDLQGTSKLYATGNVMGKIPVKINGELFEIMNGEVNAEQSGQIIYATTPEERAAANEGLRFTYEALSNFLYAKLLSSITMAPDGYSVITIKLRGSNPEFKNGRPVELNLKVEQNLLDLMQSLSISSNIEQSISEKVLQRQKK